MNSRMAVITFMDSDNDNRPDNSLPGGAPGHPSQGLPPGAVTLPVFPFDPTLPDQGLPPTTPPPTPGQPLPTPPVRPSQPIAPGGRFVVKWFACHGLILVPDNALPPTAQPK
jgi:hypothetical protein